MARSVRKGVLLKLGVLSTPVDLTTAVDAGSAPQFHTVCVSGHEAARIKSEYVCPECGNNDRGSFLKAAPHGDELVVVDDSTIDQSVDESVKDSIGLTAHPAADLEGATLPGGKVYFLAPGKGGSDIYALVRDVVNARRDVALLAEFAVRGKPALYRLDTFRDALVIIEQAWPEAIREATGASETPPAEAVAMLGQLIDKTLCPYDADDYRDKRGEFLAAAVEAAATGDPTVLPAAPAAASADDLMATLAAALGQAA